MFRGLNNLIWGQDAEFNILTKHGEPQTIYLQDISVDNPVEWEWDFGDGTKSNLQNPSHTYKKPGTYIINLRVTFADGVVKNSTSNPITFLESGESVPQNPSPLPIPNKDQFANFKIVPIDYNTIYVQDVSTGSPIYWNWNFGDGTVANSQKVSHTYLNPGPYIVQLKVYFYDGSSDTVRKLVFVQDSLNMIRELPLYLLPQLLNPSLQPNSLCGPNTLCPLGCKAIGAKDPQIKFELDRDVICPPCCQAINTKENFMGGNTMYYFVSIILIIILALLFIKFGKMSQ